MSSKGTQRSRKNKVGDLDGIFLVIPGQPVSKPRMTKRDKWAKRACVLKYFAWRDKARDIAGKLPPAKEIGMVEMFFDFLIPTSLSKRQRSIRHLRPHRQRPDIDNLIKGVLDALFEEDAGVPCVYAEKRWSDSPKVTVVISI